MKFRLRKKDALSWYLKNVDGNSTIKNMGVILMLAAAFCARIPKNLIIKLLVLSNQFPRKRLSDIPDYPFI